MTDDQYPAWDSTRVVAPPIDAAAAIAEAEAIMQQCDWCDDPQPGWTLVDGWHVSPVDEYGLEPQYKVKCPRA